MIGLAQAKRFYHASVTWFGNGEKHVPHVVAQRRSEGCLACPHHVERPLQELLTGIVGGLVKKQLELKAHLELRVEREAELHTCGLCECYLPLKCWCPLDIARANTPDWQTFPSMCWLHGQCEANAAT